MLTSSPNDLESFWITYTANRQFKAQPRLFGSAKDMHYRTSDGRAVLDGTAGLWCCNAGHSRPKIVEAVQRQIEELDYAPAFQMGHPKAFVLANRLVQLTPDHVFFTNSGSEAVDTALKTALAYHQARGQGSRVRLIGRERGYHGSGFGGVSTGGISSNREAFGPLLPGIDHLRHTHDPNRNAFSRGIPEHGMEFADDLERIVSLHGASTIAAVIVEPVAGSTGVFLPAKGYLERLRAICDRHGILLIFDEVITGFGRLGTPFAADYFGVTALSDKEPAVRLAVVASHHEQPVPIFQQLAGGHTSSRDDVREISAVAAQRRRSVGRARDRHQPRDRPVWWNRFGPMFAAEIRKRRVVHMRSYPQWRWHWCL
jgi:beta-alanine--pyruvate transaminase